MKYSEYLEKKEKSEMHKLELVEKRTALTAKLRDGAMHEPYDLYVANFALEQEKAFVFYQEFVHLMEIIPTMVFEVRNALNKAGEEAVLDCEDEAQLFIDYAQGVLGSGNQIRTKLSAHLIGMSTSLEALKKTERNNMEALFALAKKFLEAEVFFDSARKDAEELVIAKDIEQSYLNIIERAKAAEVEARE